MRFQPRLGRYLAAAAENIVSILDVETQICIHSLQVNYLLLETIFSWDISFASLLYNNAAWTKFPRNSVSHFYYLLSSSPNQISSFKLQGHTKHVHSVCWDPSGEYVVSVSEDSVRVWSLSSGNDGECVHELSCSGNKFHSCVFHPTYPHLLVIGCYQVSHISLRSYFVTYCLTDF